MKESTSEATNYCTFFPEGNWSHCCKAHDKAYELQVPKGQADKELFSCVKDSSDGVGILLVASLMFAGLALFGGFWYRKAKVKE